MKTLGQYILPELVGCINMSLKISRVGVIYIGETVRLNVSFVTRLVLAQAQYLKAQRNLLLGNV